jgi:hypothetical protein
MVQIEQTESRHVMRMQMQIAPTVRAAAGIGRPEDIGNTDRLKEVLPCKFQQALAGRCRNDAGEQVVVTAAIGVLRAGLCSHRNRERECRPVPAVTHAGKSLFSTYGVAIKA